MKKMNNIFEGAKFGDKFLTEYNQLAIYVNKNIVNNCHGLLLNPGGTIYVDDFGKSVSFGLTGYATHEIDIVSPYQEPIDKEKLEQLAKQNCPTSGSYGEGYIEGFVDGYHKAKEELL